MVDVFALANAASLDEFAVPVTYDPRVSTPGWAPFAARGIFDADHELVLQQIEGSEFDAAGHSTTGPVLALRPSELGLEPKQGDRVTIAGKVYAIYDVRPDGDDWVDLVLKARV
jgi:hypothetical protein